MDLPIIFLSRINDLDSAQLLQDAVNSLSISLFEITYEIIVIESGNLDKAKEVTLEQATILAFEGKGFNFHIALNQGLKFAQGEYVCFSNNDVVFHKNWFHNIKKVLIENNFKAASPIDPTDDKLWMFDKKNVSFIEGYEIQKFFKGWCFVVEKQVFKRLRKFDERFEFYFAY